MEICTELYKLYNDNLIDYINCKNIKIIISRRVKNKYQTTQDVRLPTSIIGTRLRIQRVQHQIHREIEIKKK